MAWTCACPSEIRINYLSNIWFNYKILLWMVPCQGLVIWAAWQRFSCPHFRILSIAYITNTPLIQYQQAKRCITKATDEFGNTNGHQPCGYGSLVDYTCTTLYLQVMDFSVHTVKWELYSWTAKESSWWAWSDKVWLLPAGFGVMSHGSYASLEGSNGSELPVNDLLHQLTLSVFSRVPMVGIISIVIVSYHHYYICYLTLLYH